MFKNKKQGFSLIEVMILFTLLAVILAASMPILTKKSNPIPRRVNHGVYRCYADQAGNIIEELYSASGLVYSNTLGQAQCKFSVPTASVYNVEMYGAGAGGTSYAEMTPTLSQDEDREFTLDKAAQYAKNSDTNIINPKNSGYKLTDSVIKAAFSDKAVQITAFSQNAGKGGTAKAVFYSPSNIRCNKSGLDNTIKDLDIRPFDNAFKSGDNYIVPIKTKDGSNKDYENFQNQIDVYCKLASMTYAERLNVYTTGSFSPTSVQSGALSCPDDGKNCFHYVGLPKEVEEKGGAGGLGKFSNLRYILPSNVPNNSIDPDFPYVKYIGSIYGDQKLNNKLLGFKPASCENSGNCDETIPSEAKDGNKDTEGVKHIDFTSAILETLPQNNKLVETDSGESVKRKLAWRLPGSTYKSGNVIPAKGGTGGYIKVDTASSTSFIIPIGKTMIQTLLNNNYFWTLLKNNDINDGDSAKVINATTGKAEGIEYQIIGDIKGTSQTPSISIKSKMLEKHYRLGKPGSYGQKRTFKVSTLGKSCTLHVAQGGAPLDYANLLVHGDKSGQSGQGLTKDQISSIAREMESRLNTYMTCKDGDNFVFEDSVEGGKYDLSFYEASPFVWNDEMKKGEEYTVSSDDAAEKPNNPIESIFGHAYKKLFSKLYVRDIEPLTKYNISYGGAGTTLKDKCTVPKGFREIRLVTKTDTYKINDDKDSSDYGKITTSTQMLITKMRDVKDYIEYGKLNSINCYHTNYGDVVDLITDNSLHAQKKEKLILTDDLMNGSYNKDKLYSINVGPGGGGAIVITW